jgi:hypothetical protein
MKKDYNLDGAVFLDKQMPSPVEQRGRTNAIAPARGMSLLLASAPAGFEWKSGGLI